MCTLLEDKPSDAIVIVVSPLKSLIKDQVCEAKQLSSSLGINACDLDDINTNRLKAGKSGFNIIFAIPEVWLQVSSKDLLSSKYFRRFSLFVLWLTKHTKSLGECLHQPLGKLLEKHLQNWRITIFL